VLGQGGAPALARQITNAQTSQFAPKPGSSACESWTHTQVAHKNKPTVTVERKLFRNAFISILLNSTKQIRSHNVLLRGIQVKQNSLMEQRNARFWPDMDLNGQFALRRNRRVDDCNTYRRTLIAQTTKPNSSNIPAVHAAIGPSRRGGSGSGRP